MSMGIIIVLFIILRTIANHVNKHNLVDKTFEYLQDPNSTCNRCGRDVSLGSDLWSGRKRDYDSLEVRKSKGAKYPEGNFICGECLEEESRR